MVCVPGFDDQAADGYVDSAGALEDFVVVCEDVVEFGPAGCDV